MKKLIIIILLLMATVSYAGIVKEIDFEVSIGHCSYIDLTFAEEYGENYIIYGNLMNTDSLVIANNCYFLDTDAPFTVTAPELDSLLIWNPDYVESEE